MLCQRGPGAAARQAAALQREGVRVHTDSMSEFSIDLGEYGWFPDRLPGEEGSSNSSSDAEDNGGDRDKSGTQGSQGRRPEVRVSRGDGSR